MITKVAMLIVFLFGNDPLCARQLPNRPTVRISFAAGIGITLVNMIMRWPAPINAGAIAMIAGLVSVPVVSLITPRLNKEIVTNAFCCIKERLPEE